MTSVDLRAFVIFVLIDILPKIFPPSTSPMKLAELEKLLPREINPSLYYK